MKKTQLKVVKQALVDKINEEGTYTNITIGSVEYLPDNYKVEKLREIRKDNPGDVTIAKAVAKLIQSLNRTKY